jgi:hypothetical protein
MLIYDGIWLKARYAVHQVRDLGSTRYRTQMCTIVSVTRDSKTHYVVTLSNHSAIKKHDVAKSAPAVKGVFGAIRHDERPLRTLQHPPGFIRAT